MRNKNIGIVISGGEWKKVVQGIRAGINEGRQEIGGSWDDRREGTWKEGQKEGRREERRKEGREVGKGKARREGSSMDQ